MAGPSIFSSWTVCASVAAGLTVLTWVFFYFETPDAPLSTISTTVVFGGWFVVVMLTRFALHRLTRRTTEN
jgi:hypothetical protein